MKWLHLFIDRQKAKGVDVAPLFGFLKAGEEEAPVIPAPVIPAPVIPAPVIPALVVVGPCPLLEQARADLEAAADRIVARAADLVKPGPLRLYRLLVVAALGRLVSQGVRRWPDIAELHMPGELAALLLGVDRVTVWRWARELGSEVDEDTGEVTGAGLLARHDHKATSANPYGARPALEQDKARKKAAGRKYGGRHVSDGTVWAVSLRGRAIPGLSVSLDSKRHAWRDLAADARHSHQHATRDASGAYVYGAEGLNTVWALRSTGLQQSLEGLKAETVETLAVRWAVNPGLRPPPPSNMTVANSGGGVSAVWDVLELRHIPRQERGAAIEGAALRLAAALGDLSSVGLYRWVLWRLYRLDVAGLDCWDKVVTILAAMRSEAQAGECRAPGAVFIHRLKRAGLWDLLKNVSPFRVGVAPG